MQNYQIVFEKLVSQEFFHSNIEEVKNICIAFWYENFVPDINLFTDSQLKRTGYIIDKLMRFNCLSIEQKCILRNVLKNIQQNLILDNNFSSNLETLAKKWNINSDLKHEIQQLLYLQKRHYIHLK